jgi:hypothetical protein
MTNDYQLVTAADAAALADALERALPDIPNESAWSGPPGGIRVLPDGTTEDLPEPNALQYWAGNKAYLQEFIAYCRAGAFAIG